MKEDEKIKFTNGMFDLFIDDSGRSPIMKILNSEIKDEYSSERYKLFTLFHRVTSSPEFKAYIDTRKELIDKFNKRQEALPKDSKERKPPKIMNVDGLIKLMESYSGFEIERIKILSKSLPPNVTPLDMQNTSWIIDYHDGGNDEEKDT